MFAHELISRQAFLAARVQEGDKETGAAWLPGQRGSFGRGGENRPARK